MTNRRARPLLDLIDRLDDLVLLVETDVWWDAQLASVKARYPHRLTRPRPDYSGLHLLSRFELVEPEIRFLIDGYVPSIRTGVRLPSGALIDFHGVHPKPPPYQDTSRPPASSRRPRATGQSELNPLRARARCAPGRWHPVSQADQAISFGATTSVASDRVRRLILART
jgi:hypothetical protein